MKNSTIGRLNTPSQLASPSSFPVNMSDGIESITANGGANDGSHDTIVSYKLSEQVFINYIGKMKKVEPIFLLVAIKDADTA